MFCLCRGLRSWSVCASSARTTKVLHITAFHRTPTNTKHHNYNTQHNPAREKRKTNQGSNQPLVVPWSLVSLVPGNPSSLFSYAGIGYSFRVRGWVGPILIVGSPSLLKVVALVCIGRRPSCCISSIPTSLCLCLFLLPRRRLSSFIPFSNRRIRTSQVPMEVDSCYYFARLSTLPHRIDTADEMRSLFF